MAGSFLFLKLTDKLACQGVPSVFGVLRPDELSSANEIMAIDEQESLTFRYPTVDAMGGVRPMTAQMKAGRVITVVWDDGSFDEWRVGVVITGRGEQGIATVQCIHIWLDLVERADSVSGKGWVSDLTAGERNFEYELTQRSASSILSTYVIPACPSWVTLGTVDPTYVIPSLTLSRLTPAAVTNAVRDALRNVDVPCEARLRRNGTTDYKLDLVTQIGASANTPVFHPSNALVSLQQKSDPTLQATRVLTKGAMAPDGNPGQWGFSRWRVSALSGLVVTLVDRNGGAVPIAFDGQFVGMVLVRVKTGRTFAITASAAAAGTVTLGGGVSTLAVDEDVEFRLTEPLNNTRRVGALDPYLVRPYTLSAVSGTDLTVSQSDFPVATDPVSVTNENVDWYARRATFVMASVTNTGFLAGVVKNCTSVAGVAAGDILFLTTSPTPAYNLNANGAMVVDSVTASDITCHSRDGYAPFYFSGVSYFRVYRPVATLARITASVAATNIITVTAAGSAAVSDLIEFVQVDGAGELPSFVDHPVYIQPDPTGYGVKVMELSKPMLGIVQLSPNGWQRAWSNAANPPDGWSVSGAGTPSQNTNAAFTRYGGASYRLVGAVTAQAPVAYPAYDAGHTALSGRTWVYPAIFPGNVVLTFTVYAATPAGALGAVLGSVSITPIGSTSSGTRVGTGAWVELKVEGMRLSDGTAPYGVIGVVASPATADVYVDVLELYPFLTCPNDDFEFGDAMGLLQAANNQLRLVASPPLYYTVTVRDLERLDPTAYARLGLTVGANVRAADLDYGIDTTVRLLRRDRDLKHAEKTTLTLANRPTLLTNLQSDATAQRRRIVAAVIAGTAGVSAPAPAFVALSGATTLPIGAEIVTPLAGAPAVTLPTPVAASSGVPATGASVTYAPTNPATTPTTTVTVGRPPTRQKPSGHVFL